MVTYLLLSNLTSKTIFKKHIHAPSISIYFNRRAERGKLTGVNGTQGGGGPALWELSQAQANWTQKSEKTNRQIVKKEIEIQRALSPRLVGCAKKD